MRLNNPKLTAGAVVVLLGVVGFKAWRRYQRSDEKRELDQLTAENDREHAERMKNLDEIRARIITVKSGLAACDTLRELRRRNVTCRETRAASGLNTTIDRVFLDALEGSASSAAELETKCKATLDKVALDADKHGCTFQ